MDTSGSLLKLPLSLKMHNVPEHKLAVAVCRHTSTSSPSLCKSNWPQLASSCRTWHPCLLPPRCQRSESHVLTRLVPRSGHAQQSNTLATRPRQVHTGSMLSSGTALQELHLSYSTTTYSTCTRDSAGGGTRSKPRHSELNTMSSVLQYVSVCPHCLPMLIFTQQQLQVPYLLYSTPVKLFGHVLQTHPSCS